MVSVFGVFVVTGVPSVKEVGLGCAVAIALDATVVRLVLVPATMEMLGALELVAARRLARAFDRLSLEPVAAPVSAR